MTIAAGTNHLDLGLGFTYRRQHLVKQHPSDLMAQSGQSGAQLSTETVIIPDNQRSQLQRSPEDITAAEMYNRAFLRWLSKRQIKYKPIKHKRNTIRSRQTKVGRLGWTPRQEGETLEEAFAVIGIQLQHRSISWDERSRIENCHPTAKHRCYSESKLRWSWTMACA
jgi:hypothetical protein